MPMIREFTLTIGLQGDMPSGSTSALRRLRQAPHGQCQIVEYEECWLAGLIFTTLHDDFPFFGFCRSMYSD